MSSKPNFDSQTSELQLPGEVFVKLPQDMIGEFCRVEVDLVTPSGAKRLWLGYCSTSDEKAWLRFDVRVEPDD